LSHFENVLLDRFA